MISQRWPLMNGHIGGNIEKITAAGFKIVALKYIHNLGLQRWRKNFIVVHRERPFLWRFG